MGNTVQHSENTKVTETDLDTRQEKESTTMNNTSLNDNRMGANEADMLKRRELSSLEGIEIKGANNKENEDENLKINDNLNNSAVKVNEEIPKEQLDQETLLKSDVGQLEHKLENIELQVSDDKNAYKSDICKTHDIGQQTQKLNKEEAKSNDSVFTSETLTDNFDLHSDRKQDKSDVRLILKSEENETNGCKGSSKECGKEATTNNDTTKSNESDISNSESNITGRNSNIIDSTSNFADSENNLADSESNVADSESNLGDSKSNVAESESNIEDSKSNIEDSENTNVDSESNFADSESTVADSEYDVPDSESNVADSESNIADSEIEESHGKCLERDVQRIKIEKTPKKELPEWFKVMVGLTHGIHDGKEMEHWEDIRESIDIHGSTQASTVRTNKRLIQLIMKRISRISRRDRALCSCIPNFEGLKSTFQSKTTTDLNSLVSSLLKPIADIDDVDISCEGVRAPCHTGGSTLLHIRCTSCQSLYRVVAILNSPLFKDGIIRIKECLEHEMKDKLDIDANITPESIHDVKNHLREQGILKGTDEFVGCGAHPGKLSEVYCYEHDDICCTACCKSQHSSCHDVTTVTKDVGEKKKRKTIKRKVKEYYVRIDSDNGDEGNCDIIACCTLPDGDLLLADMNNKRLKRLSSTLSVVYAIDLPDCPRDVCYIGNDRVAVILFDHSIQFVDMSGSPELKEKVDLDHDCFGVACRGETLYVTDPMSVYMYSLEGKEKGGLYRQLAGHHRFSKIAVSEEKDKLYIAAREGGLITIDFDGNRLSSLRGRELGIVSDVCVADDGTLLVCNSRMQTVSRVDSEGKTVLEKVAGRSEDMYMPQSLCYDKHGHRLIVGHLHDDYISVLNIK